MPAGKYYCDYCDKEFQDTPAARKRHVYGVHHQRNKSLWYASFNINKDPTQFPSSAQGIVKGICNRFVNTGACPYGDSCKYMHPNQNVHIQSLNAPPPPPPPPPPPAVAGAANTARQSFGMSLGNLPPSLRPPPEGGYPPLPFVDWG